MAPKSDQSTAEDRSRPGTDAPVRPLRRRIRWWALGVMVALGLGAAAIIHYLPQLARPVVQSVAADLGLAGLDLQFDDIGWRRTVVRDVTLGQAGAAAPDLSIGRVELTYTISDLLAGRIGSLRLVDAVLRGRVAEDGPDFGALSPLVDRLRSSGGEPPGTGAASLPSDRLAFDRLDVAGARVLLATPEGAAELSLQGGIEVADDASAIMAAFTVALAGDLAQGKGRIEADVSDAGQVVRFLEFDLMSDHVLLPGAVSVDQATGEIRPGAGGRLDMELAGEVAFAADPARPLPVASAHAPLDIQMRFDPAGGLGVLAMGGCMPLSITAAADAGWSVGDITLCADDGRPLAEIDMSGGAAAVKADFVVMPAHVKLGSLLDGTSPRLDVDVRQGADDPLVIRAAFSGGDISLPGQALHLTGLEGSAALVPGGAGQLGRFDIDRVTVADSQAAPRFAPVAASADLSLDGLGEDGILAGRIKGPVRVATPSGLPLVRGTVSHGLGSGEGRLDFSTDTLSFAEGSLQPQELAPVLRGIVAAVSGDVGMSGRLRWDGNGLISSGATATLSDIGMQASAARFGGISGEIAFSSLVPVRTRGTQAVSIGVVDAGLPLEGGIALVRVEGGGDVIIENAQWPFAGGQLVLTSGALNTGAPVQRAELAALSVNLRELLNLIEMEGLTGDGLLGGAVPIEIRDGSVYVMAAKLEAEPGGVIRYSTPGTDAAGQTAQGANIAFQALENFHFDVLSVEIDGPVDGELSLKIVLQGANPDLLEGYPVHLNVTTQGAFLELLRRGTVGLRALDVVTGKENLDGLDVERVEPAP